MSDHTEEDSREIRFPRGERHRIQITCRTCGCVAIAYPWHVMCSTCERVHGVPYMQSSLGSQGRKGGQNKARMRLNG